MHPADKALALASSQSRAMISAGHTSYAEGAAHVRQSKEAVARSLDLLSSTKVKI